MSESNKSTGPRTPEGKAISSQNALKHGLSARDVVLKDDEEREEFAKLLADLAAELHPDGALETLLFNRILRASWDIRRVERMEVDQASYGIDLLDDTCHLCHERLSRYKMRAERSFYKAHREITAPPGRAPRPGQGRSPGRGRRGSSFWRAKMVHRVRRQKGRAHRRFGPLRASLQLDDYPDDLTPPSAA